MPALKNWWTFPVTDLAFAENTFLVDKLHHRVLFSLSGSEVCFWVKTVVIHGQVYARGEK